LKIEKDKGKDPMIKKYKIVKREWKTNTYNKKVSKNNVVVLKLMHWNILAQRLAYDFDKIPNNSPIMYYKNRLNLMK